MNYEISYDYDGYGTWITEASTDNKDKAVQLLSNLCNQYPNRNWRMLESNKLIFVGLGWNFKPEKVK